MCDAYERPITVFDIGGTHLRWARWTSAQGLGVVQRTPSPSFLRTPQATVAELQGMLVRTMTGPVPPSGIVGISFGAALDGRTGTVYASAPLWGGHAGSFDLLAALRTARPDARWHLVNDVTAALLHLMSAPLARDCRKVLLATVSTGIACRTIDRRTGEIAVDACGLQGEIGHLPAAVAVDGEPVDLTCDCGAPGHVAAFSSGPGLHRLAGVMAARRPREWAASGLGRRLVAGTSFEQALTAALDDGDPTAGDLLAAATGPVADIVRTALCLDPALDLIAFTGGVAVGLGHHYGRALAAHLTREGLYLTSRHFPGWLDDRLLVCEPGEADGLVGAGLAAVAAESAPESTPPGQPSPLGKMVHR